MADGAHRENGRPKPPQGQWFLQHQPSMKQIMSIMAERDAAIQERNVALSEKKSALAERDMAILHRDSAISERNSAIMERDNAIAALEYRKNAMSSGLKYIHHHPHPHMHHQTHVEERPYNSVEMQHISEPHPLSPPQPEPAKPKKAKKAKEPKTMTPNKKPAKKKIKRERDDYEEGSKSNWKDQDLGLNEVAYDDSMPVPVCSCTGVYRSCYKWGSGGWQSSCCTTTMSVYPLPQVPNKRHARIGGRKMSGSAYNKLLRRLVAEGHDLSNPVDLKDNWAKHGTNRYITIR